ncbi:MAG: hypothetical protein QNJ40_03040 [Xanthomonadales bacterium]|nr:hypothetical protein [Xanthomonadales bacterium]
MNGHSVLLICLLAFAGGALAQPWSTEPVNATETLVGFSAPSEDFAIGVGNAGQIVHFNQGDAGTIVPSGTSKDLLDVLAVDETFAVASGQDLVLIWNNGSWSPLFPENTGDPRFFTPVWAPPEKDLVIYQELASGGGFGFNTVCPYVIADPDASAFCRLSSRPVLTLCGSSNDVKALYTDGTIRRFTDGALSNADDPMDLALYEQPGGSPLNLIAAYIPEDSCVPGDFAPSEIFAVNQAFNNEFWKFDGQGWTKQADAGPNDTLTGMAGYGPNLVFAVGRRPGAMKGPSPNEGVAWGFDGTTWIEEALPPGAPGMADVAAGGEAELEIFTDGFEAVALKNYGTLFPRTRGVGEGRFRFRRWNRGPGSSSPTPAAVLRMLTRLRQGPTPTNPLLPGGRFTVLTTIDSNTPGRARFYYRNSRVRYVSSTCGATETIINQSASDRRWGEYSSPGSASTCEVTFEVPTENTSGDLEFTFQFTPALGVTPLPRQSYQYCGVRNQGTAWKCDFQSFRTIAPE